MSDLYRSALSARIAKLPSDIPEPFNESDEDESGDTIGALPGSGMGPPAIPRLHRTPKTPNPSFSPISASEYFEAANTVSVPSRAQEFRVYYTPPKYSDGMIMVCHHGAGYTGLTFSVLAKEVKEQSKEECGVFAYDARRHGKTKSTLPGTEPEDLSIDVLVEDVVALVQTVFPDPSATPPVLLVGHSMGGSVMTRTCPKLLEKKYQVGGVAIVEAVEGFALEALPHMHTLLNSRPDGFDNIEEGVEWHVKTKTIRNSQSARISVPSMLVENPNPPPKNMPPMLWRTPLRSTAPYWQGWFEQLSSLFLACRTARLLVLAGTERLDKELMIGQMQGKFQLVVIPGSGHMVQEDEPMRLAEVLVEFWRRNERVIPGVKKVGDL